MNQRAFTLIELLIVIAIIALLLALALPALGRARDSGRTLKCQTTLHDLSIASGLYANDYKDYVPREGTLGATADFRRHNIPWNVGFRPYVDNRAAPSQDINDKFAAAPYYRCPAVVQGDQPVHYVSNGFAFTSPGVVDQRGTVDETYRRGPTLLSLVRAPLAVPYLSELADDPQDALYSGWNRLGKTDMSLGQCYDLWLPRHLTPGSGDYRINPARHMSTKTGVAAGGASNAAFFDSHVTIVTSRFLADPNSWDDGFYTGGGLLIGQD
jgi:prepilin-type N-terminal cleavage/methylation domain-containing protein/prepilin-type processing-associated H-X9-DG protein